jgi:predicted amidohydrolase YtcJ
LPFAERADFILSAHSTHTGRRQFSVMASTNAPDLIVFNADIRTMDPLQPRAQALAARAGRILALGSDAEIRAMANRSCRKIDAGGRLVLPGFQDTHIHLQDSGTGFSTSVNLERARSVEDLQKLIREFAAKRTNDPWIRGVGWYSGIFGAHNLDRQVLDIAVPDRPVYIYASDGHNAAVNSKACEELGLNASVADPHGGQFVRDKDGNPT